MVDVVDIPDDEARRVKKGKDAFFGYRGHSAVDTAIQLCRTYSRVLAAVRPEGPKSPEDDSKASENRPKPTDSLRILKSSVNDSSDDICAAVMQQSRTGPNKTRRFYTHRL